MKNIFRTFFIIATLSVACGCSTSSEPSTKEPESLLDVQTLNQAIGRGMNLGNALEAPNEGEWGVFLQAEYFKLIKNAGFNSVRIPIRWSSHAQADSPFTIESAFFERVDWAVQQAFNNDLVAIINIHHYQELFSSPSEHRKRFLGL